MRLLLVILSVWMLKYSLASDLKCSYSYYKKLSYTCITMDFKLDKENALIDTVIGQHLPGKTQINVEALVVESSNNKFLSLDIFKKFPNLKNLVVLGSSVEKIGRGNFHGAQHLESLFIKNNKISELTDNIFSGAFNLDRVSMKYNRIKSISNQTFDGLTNLKIINLDHNYLESLPKGIFDDLINLNYVSLFGNILTRLDEDLFKNNLKIETLWFSNNSLSVIGSNLITNLRSLKFADFNENPCISEIFPWTVNINVLNEKIAKCTESNKPEQKLILFESEKKKANEKNDLLSKKNEDLRKVLEIGKLDLNVDVQQQEVSNLSQNNNELNESSMIQLQEIGKLDPNVDVQQQEVSNLSQNNNELNKSSMNRVTIHVLLGGILLLFRMKM